LVHVSRPAAHLIRTRIGASSALFCSRRSARTREPTDAHLTSHPAALTRLAAIPRIRLIAAPSPVEEATRLREALAASLGSGGAGAPRVLVKRDDAIPFAFGGNKVRKLELVLAAALAAG